VTVAHVSGFGGGVVGEGGADSQRTDELKVCESYDIGPRGALIAGRGVKDYVTINDLGTVPAPFTKVYGLGSAWAGSGLLQHLAVGEGLNVATLRFFLAKFARASAASPIGTTDILLFGAPSGGAVPAPAGTNRGVLVTFAAGITDQVLGYHVALVNIGHREGAFPEDTGAPGLYALTYVPSGPTIALTAINYFDALGTGPSGEFPTGTQSKQLYFRGIVPFNSYVFGWGYENGKYLGNAPARLSFCNSRNPFKWGNDNIGAVGADRAFTDTDAVQIGDAGEFIRGALAWNGRLWVGTDKQMHYLAGYGRDSWTTDGANPVAKAENIGGPHCLIEGPDRLLYGVGDKGLWAFDGQNFERHHRRLRDYAGASTGWWDLIWVDRTRGDTYPGKTNQDLVWMVVDWDADQVLVGIPWCSASAGSGYGTDTVVIRFHVRTGGFTRQIYTGVQYTAADYVRRQSQYDTERFLATATAGSATIKRYAGQATPVGAGGADYMPTAALLKVEFGPYALFGANGVGIYRKAYLTLAAPTSVLGTGNGFYQWSITPYVDGQALAAFKLSIDTSAPGSPADGDIWVDTSGTDTSLGNASAGTLIAAAADYLVKIRWNSSWKIIPVGGQKEGRFTVPLTWKPTRGTRLVLKIDGTQTHFQYQFEGLGFDPPLLKVSA